MTEKQKERILGIECKNLCKIVKSAVSKANLKRYNELYKRLETKEGKK